MLVPTNPTETVAWLSNELSARLKSNYNVTVSAASLHVYAADDEELLLLFRDDIIQVCLKDNAKVVVKV